MELQSLFMSMFVIPITFFFPWLWSPFPICLCARCQEGSTITQLNQALVLTLLFPSSCSPPPSYPVVSFRDPNPPIFQGAYQTVRWVPFHPGCSPACWDALHTLQDSCPEPGGMLPMVKAEWHVWLSRTRNLNYISYGSFITAS